ncbi:MAG: Rieske (2Fe-2S) protein [Desulfobacteraceae bacterium]|nr:Rieske (2Fe-2S) protein [Desulfobacteraceae bacterium]MBC2757143.1 Rieske (2Fe-2S) protein [Desulfobacteraceae bacterium]
MNIKFLNRSFFQRLFGKPVTPETKNLNSWDFANGKLRIDLEKTPELKTPGHALRFEDRNLPVRVLVVFGENKTYRAYQNRCTHIGHRRLDPVPGTQTVQCCSINKSTYDLDGNQIYGPAPHPITTYKTSVENNRLIVTISQG